MLRHPHNIRPADLMSAAEERGWVHDRTSGSHLIYRKGAARLSIPQHVRAPGTIRSIIEVLLSEENDG